MKKAIIISSYILFGAALTFGVMAASWSHYKLGSSELSEEAKKVEVDVYDLPESVDVRPNRVYYKKVTVTTSIQAGTFPFLIKEVKGDTLMSDNGVAQIFSDEKN